MHRVMNELERLRSKYMAIRGSLHERARREWAGAEALAIGRGGVKLVHEATGLAPSTISKGKREILARGAGEEPPTRVRAPGAGRPALAEAQPGLMLELERCVEPGTRGDPESPLRWTTKSVRTLARELRARGYRIGPSSVGKLLRDAGYSLQSNQKRLEGKQHPDRDAQFQYLNARMVEQLAFGNPAISVDTEG